MFLSIEETNENALTINQSLLLLTDLAKEIGIDLEEKDNSNFRHSYGLRGTDNIFKKNIPTNLGIANFKLNLWKNL